MAKVFVITSGKGGVGKTTTTANIGVGLATSGKRTLLIDADIGLRNLDVVMGLENRIVYDLLDIIEGRCKKNKAFIRDKRCGNLFLLPAAQNRDKDAVSPEQMRALVEEFKEDFDYIIIDCPAGIEQGFKNAISAADQALIVTTPEVSAVRDADRIVGLLEANDVTNSRLIINRIKMNMVREGNMLDVSDITDVLGLEVIGVIPDDEHIVISTNKGEPVVFRGSSLAAQAYRNITDRLLDKNVKFLDLAAHDGFLNKVKSFFRS